MAQYRWIVILAAAGAAVACAFAIYFNVMALAKYRHADFLEATSTKDFTLKGSCVEVVTKDQLKGYGYNEKLDSDSNGCAANNDDGKQLEMRRTLEVSAHGIYYSYFTAGLNDWSMRTVAEAVLTATIAMPGSTPPTVNLSTAYDGLSRVAEQTIPIANGCDTIYGMSGESSITRVEATAFLAQLRAGKYKSNGKKKADWPLKDITVTCNNAETLMGTNIVDVTGALDTLEKEKLYAHCLAQFYFASSGTLPGSGTFGVPLVGEDAGPGTFFYPNAKGFGSGSDYNTKVRMFLGQRFGYCVWAYVPMLLATCYLCADAVVFFLAEATLPDVLLETQTISNNRVSMMRDSLVIAATSATSRGIRFSIGCAAVIVSWLFYGIFILAPWGLVETKMGRPVCESEDDGEPKHLFLAELGWRGTTGGWKSDWDAGWYELATLLIQLGALLLLPLTTTRLFWCCNRPAGSSTDKDRLVAGDNDEEPALVTNKSQLRRLMGLFIWPLLLGAIVLIAGQAVSGARFGMAWAEGVVGKQTHTDKTTGVVTLAFDEVTLSEQVYDQTVATLAVTVVIGFLLGTVVQRHLIAGVGCYSALLFFAWLALVVVFALPLLIYASVRSIFNQGEANEDCAAFPDSGYDFEKGACEARWWTFLIGGSLVALTVVLITAFGLLEAIPNILRVKSNAAVRLKKLRGRHKAFFENKLNYTTVPFKEQDSFDANKHALGGFRSPDESFFNYDTGVSGVDSREVDRLLYAPRVTFALPEAALGGKAQNGAR